MYKTPTSFEWTEELHAAVRAVGLDPSKLGFTELLTLHQALNKAALPRN